MRLIIKRIGFLFVFAAMLGSGACGQTLHTGADKTKAVSAWDFLNSLGVNSAINSRHESIDKTIECANYLGIRWIRSGYEDEITIEEHKRLLDEAGVKVSYGLLSGGNDVERLITKAREVAKIGGLIAVEGNNEPNNWGVTYRGERGGSSASWMPVATIQRDLYAAVKSDPVLKDYPVWSLSENGAQTDDTGLQFLTVPEGADTVMPAGTRYADFANCHNYISHPSWPGLHENQTWLSASPGRDCPVDGLYGNYGRTWLKKFAGYSEEDLLTLPKVTTETGVTLNDIVNEEVQGRLYMSLYLAQFARGWTHTAIYILRDRSDEDGNQTFGFYRPDYTPRPAAVYLHNLTTILADDGQVKKPGELSYEILGKSQAVHDLLLRKTNGRFYLVVWGERYAGGQDEIDIKFGKAHKVVRIYNPILGTESVETHKNAESVSLTMTTHPYVIEIEG